jgi:iron complex transport system substrate-binding protein
MKRPLLAAAIAGLVASVALVGCSSSKNHSAGSRPATSADSGSFPVTVGDVTLTNKPTRIVSLSPTATDMLFAIGAGQQVVAVDKNSASFFVTHQTANKPPADIDAYQPNAEAIAAKNPDLVVISNDTNKIKDQLQKLKIPVYVGAAAATIDDTYKQETDLGALTGHVGGAAATVSAEKKQIADLVAEAPQRTKPLKYYYELDQTLYSVTSKTFIGSLFNMVHMTNIADPADASGAAGGYPQLTSEAVVKANPDLIFLADTVCCQQSQATVAKRAGWSSISAVSNNRVVALNDDIASQWGTQVPTLLEKIVDADKAVPAN